MAHSHDAPAACPNCGYAAERNYCAQCGQETHLHKDTFWSLIVHFAGHYFHYDSKLWKTMRTLWTAPGALTVDYAAGKRARYIPPISLYILISAIYFIAGALMPESYTESRSLVRVKRTDLALVADRPPTYVALDTALQKTNAGRSFSRGLSQLERSGPEAGQQLSEHMQHLLPRLFFLMIPVTALLLHLCFVRRRDASFVQHAIFSLHVHAFFFSLFVLQALNPFEVVNNGLITLLLLVFAGYFTQAVRRVYAVGYGRAIATTLVVGAGYVLVFCLALAAVFMYLITHL